MLGRHFTHLPLPEDRGPLRVMFVHTEVVVGGAETLLLEIIRKMDRDRFDPELCCLKQLAELGEVIAEGAGLGRAASSARIISHPSGLSTLGFLVRG